MQPMLVIDIEQRRHMPLTSWMGFHAGGVSNRNGAEEEHTTHSLDGISCRQCQQSKSSRGGAHHSQAGWVFIQGMSVIEIEQRRHTPLTRWMGFHPGKVSDQNQAEEAHTTHSLGWVFMQAMSAIEIEQSRRTPLTCWMGFHAAIVSDRNRAEEACTTHSLDGISCRQCQLSKSSRAGAHHSLPGWDFM